ncbi:MAG: DNA polymerase III subunit gamma/tau [Actinomycetota bacterium]
MASLYRTHRPQRFAQLVGQNHVTTALRNAVVERRIGHAYLFSGPRGTGKTTTARLLARALNCQNLDADGEPCATCENCSAIGDGTFYDLVELDAASNNGVEAMRDLIQSVHLGLGATSMRKVYIVDEVHMLSAAASNTLLKTLEEPPEHVVFVLATTDPHKVLATIRSRTQHFEFTLLSHEQLLSHLSDILGREGIPADESALDLVARRAAGSARDALSLLDQALAVGGGQLDGPAVQDALGGAPFELRMAILEAAAAEDIAGALVALHNALVRGHDMRRVADDLLRGLRDAFMRANAPAVPYDGPAEEGFRLETLAKSMGNAAITRAIEILGQTIVDVRQQTVADPRLVLEVAIVRVARREARTSVETLLERVERLERRDDGAPPAGAGAAAAAERPTAHSGAVLQARGSELRATAPKPSAPALESEAEPAVGSRVAPDIDDVIEAWPTVLGGLSAPLAAAIQEAQPIGIENGAIVFGVPRVRVEATNKRFRSEADTIKEAFASRLGYAPRFVLRAHDFDAPDAFRPVAMDPRPLPHEEEHEIVLDELVDAHDAPPTDTVSRLVSDLGAQVLEERPHI